MSGYLQENPLVDMVDRIYRDAVRYGNNHDAGVLRQVLEHLRGVGPVEYEDAMRYRALRREILAESSIDFVAPLGAEFNRDTVDAMVDRHLRGKVPPPKKTAHIRVVKS